MTDAMFVTRRERAVKNVSRAIKTVPLKLRRYIRRRRDLLATAS